MMLLRAVAVASRTSDVVGTVELACLSEGLFLRFVRVMPYAPSSAPRPPVRDYPAIVPYAAVQEAWDDGETLRLTVQHRSLPFGRLVLAHVTRDTRIDAHGLHRRRVLGQRVVGAGAAIGLGGWVWLTQAIAPEISPLLAPIGAAAAFAGALWGNHELARRAMLGGLSSEADRRAFFGQLRAHLPPSIIIDDAPEQAANPIPGMRATNAHGASASTTSLASQGGREGSDAWSRRPALGEAAVAATEVEAPRRRFFGRELTPTWLASGAAAALALAALVGGGRVFSYGDESGNDDNVLAGSQLTAPSVMPEPPNAELSLLPPCACRVPVSPVLPVRMPRITLLSSVTRRSFNVKRPFVEVEVAAVNNGAEPVRDLKGGVSFYRPGRTEGEPPRFTVEKGFLYESLLAPGAAVKWHLGARGTTFHASTGDEEPLAESALAPPDAFARLLGARTRTVRLHGAAMLARLGDARAAAALEELRETAREDEVPVLESLARAAAPVHACDLTATAAAGGGLEVTACVANGSDDASEALDATLVLAPAPVGGGAVSEPQAAVVSTGFATGFRVPAHAGVVVRGVVDAAAAVGRDVVADVVLERHGFDTRRAPGPSH